jgi:TetR/AcrR family transcriptional regulator, cholesterol catabolism regulator
MGAPRRPPPRPESMFDNAWPARIGAIRQSGVRMESVALEDIKPQTKAGGRASKSAPTRTEILEAAASTIVENGYEGCTMRAVAARVNMKAGSLYYHFPSKEDIVGEILNLGIETLYEYVEAELAKLPADSPFEVRIRTATVAHIHCMVGTDKKFMQVYDHLPPILKRKSRKMREKYAKLWYDLFSEGVWRNEVTAGVNLKILVPYFLGGLNRVPEWLRASGSSSEDVAGLATDILLRGLHLNR